MSARGPSGQFSWAEVLNRLVAGRDLGDTETAAAMAEIMEGDVSPVRVAGFLIALRAKGESAEEVAGLVRSMRRYAVAVDAGPSVVDTCGTGGDRAGTFNVSTIAAVVAAGAGARVAKHGNRAASGKCGSADLLEAWGVAIDLPPESVAACIDQTGIGFCFAPAYHPAMRHAMPARRELGVPTVFNFLGPLTNPAGARHQTIGVSDAAMAPRMAQVLALLGTVHALVFHGEDGLDELTTTGPSRVWEVRDGQVTDYRFDPIELGVPRSSVAELRGGEIEENLRISEGILDGEPGPARDIVVLGAAAALYAADRVETMEAGLRKAAEALDSGAAKSVRDHWVRVSQAEAARAR